MLRAANKNQGLATDIQVQELKKVCIDSTQNSLRDVFTKRGIKYAKKFLKSRATAINLMQIRYTTRKYFNSFF